MSVASSLGVHCFASWAHPAPILYCFLALAVAIGTWIGESLVLAAFFLAFTLFTKPSLAHAFLTLLP